MRTCSVTWSALQTVLLGGFVLVALALGYWQFFRAGRPAGPSRPTRASPRRPARRARPDPRSQRRRAGRGQADGADGGSADVPRPADGERGRLPQRALRQQRHRGRVMTTTCAARARPIRSTGSKASAAPRADRRLGRHADHRRPHPAGGQSTRWATGPARSWRSIRRPARSWRWSSAPTFDPATIDDRWQRLSTIRAGRWSTGRSRRLYTPGSTFKVDDGLGRDRPRPGRRRCEVPLCSSRSDRQPDASIAAITPSSRS